MNILIKNICQIKALQFVKLAYPSINHFTKFNFTSSPNNDDELKKQVENNEKLIFNKVNSSYTDYKSRRENETVEVKRARLIYQSRKRGTSENGILLSNFAKKYLSGMNETQLDEYDKIINNLYNEWDIYYWLTDAVPIPKELESNSVIHELKAFCLKGAK